jgi:hypothetical protein
MPNVTFKEQEQNLKYRTDTIHTDKHTKRFSHMTGPATCPLFKGLDNAPHMLLRCNNHILKRTHINRHHHADIHCGEDISKGKLGSAVITMDACNNEKLCDLNIEPPDDIKETFLIRFSQLHKTFHLDIKTVQMACLSCPLKKEAGIWTPNKFPQGPEKYTM